MKTRYERNQRTWKSPKTAANVGYDSLGPGLGWQASIDPSHGSARDVDRVNTLLPQECNCLTAAAARFADDMNNTIGEHFCDAIDKLVERDERHIWDTYLFPFLELANVDEGGALIETFSQRAYIDLGYFHGDAPRVGPVDPSVDATGRLRGFRRRICRPISDQMCRSHQVSGRVDVEQGPG
jgi:hypothetical protein